MSLYTKLRFTSKEKVRARTKRYLAQELEEDNSVELLSVNSLLYSLYHSLGHYLW